MSALPTPHASRLRRPSWRDTRLVVGVLLVAIGVLLGTRAVASADQRVEVYSARHTLVPGQPIVVADLEVQRVRLEDAGRYAGPSTQLAPGAVALVRVGEGEILPRSAVGVASDVALRAVTVPVDADAMPWLHAGDLVEIWVTPKKAASPAPTLLATVTVGAVPEAQSGFGPATRASGVQVLVPVGQVPAVIGAVDREDSVTLVPVKQAI